ncbi:hypothetical protein [Actinomyces procaprae]|uniref:hypothetical protein n=1 Tax=Actinomyces procaprae TaxID=2560010 RepID=UPI00109D83E5|nr:hypothetical protein [Actinomyces procaprae]
MIGNSSSACKLTTKAALTLMAVIIITPALIVGAISLTIAHAGAPLAGALASEEAGNNDLDWQLEALESNWGVTVPDSVVLQEYHESEVGPHGEHDAVYVLHAAEVEGTWLDPEFTSPSPHRVNLIGRIAESAGATDIVDDASALSCAVVKGNDVYRSLTACRMPGIDAGLLLLERIT